MSFVPWRGSSTTRAGQRTPSSSPRMRSPARRPRPPGSTAGSRSPTAAAPGVETPTLVFARLSPSVEFGAKDGPADLAFLIAAPAGGDASHLKLLAKLARALVKKEFTDSLRGRHDARAGRRAGHAASSATSRRPPPRLRRRTRGPGPAATPAAPAAPAGQPFAGRGDGVPDRHRPHLHGREALEAAAARAGVEIHVETQGSAGATPLGPRDDRRRGRGHLRRRRRRARPAPASRASRWSSSGVKRPIDERRPDDRGSPPLRRRPQRPAGRGLRRWRRLLRRGRRRRVLGRPHASGPDDRRLLHDPVRRRGRSAHRPELPVRRLRDRRPLRRDRGQPHRCSTCPTPTRWVSTTRCSTPGSSPTSAPSSSSSARRPSCSSSRRSAGYIAYAIADRPGIAPGFVMGGLAGQPVQRHRGGRRAACRASRHRLPRRHRRRRPRGTDRPLDRRVEGARPGPAA